MWMVMGEQQFEPKTSSPGESCGRTLLRALRLTVNLLTIYPNKGSGVERGKKRHRKQMNKQHQLPGPDLASRALISHRMTADWPWQAQSSRMGRVRQGCPPCISCKLRMVRTERISFQRKVRGKKFTQNITIVHFFKQLLNVRPAEKILTSKFGQMSLFILIWISHVNKITTRGQLLLVIIRGRVA